MNTMTIPVAGVKRKIDDDASNANTNGPIYERNGLQICPKYQKKDSKTGPKKRINRRPRQASYFEKVIEEILATMDPKDHSMPDVTPPSPPTRFERTINPKDNMMPSCAMRTPSPPTRFEITTNPKDNVMPSCAMRTPSPPPKARHNNSSTASNVEELCRISDLKDVNIDYKKAEFQINSCNFFQRYVYPILARENPHATRKKVMDLAAAKWREFSSKNQHPNQLNADEGEEQDIKPTLPSTTKLQERGIEVRPVRANEGRKQIIEPTSNISSPNQRDAVSERDGKQTLQQALRVCPLIPATFASPPPSFVFASSTNIYAEMPKTEEICSTFGLKDVNIDYTKAVTEETTRDFVSFNKFVRPKLLKENPWAPMGKILMLVAAKWREFLNTNPSSGAIKKPDLTKEPKPEEIRDKQPSRNWKRLINKSKKYRNINPHTNDEQKHAASSTDLASQTADVSKNSDEYCSRRLDDSISKLAISLKANCDAQSKCTTGLERFVKQLRATMIETSHGDSTSNRSSSASGIETQTACPEVSQKLARPILVEKNSQVLPEKSTFLDEVTGKRFIVRQKQTSGELPNYFVVTRDQENVSKPSIILPPKSKSLVVDEGIEDRSIIHNNRNTKRIIVRSSSSASALGDQFQSSPPSVKTEPEDETDRSNHAVNNDYENDTDSERENNTSSPNSFSVSGFNYLRRLVVNLAAQGEPKEEPKAEPEEDPNEELEEEPKEEPREELEKEPKEEPQSFSEDSTDGRSEREDTVNTVDQNPRFLANADLRTTIVNRMNGDATHLSSESKIDNVPGQKGEDEYDVFGRWVAMKIRKMCSPLLKLQIESEISSLLLQKSAEDAGFSVICTSAMSTSGDETA